LQRVSQSLRSPSRHFLILPDLQDEKGCHRSLPDLAADTPRDLQVLQSSERCSCKEIVSISWKTSGGKIALTCCRAPTRSSSSAPPPSPLPSPPLPSSGRRSMLMAVTSVDSGFFRMNVRIGRQETQAMALRLCGAS
jgi:hypothetical protein